MGYQIIANNAFEYRSSANNAWKYQVTEYAMPFRADILSLYSGRSELELIDSEGNESITISTPVLCPTISQVTGQGGVPERLFDGNSYTVYFKFKLLKDLTGVVWLFRMGNNSGTERGFALWSSGQIIYNQFSDGVNTSAVIKTTTANTTIQNAGWCECLMQINFDTKRAICNFYKYSDGASLATNVDVDISSWTFGANNNAAVLSFPKGSFYAYSDFKKFNAIKTITQCRDASYMTDAQFYYPTLWDCTDVSGNDIHLEHPGSYFGDNRYYSDISTYCLDYGYTLYRSSWKYNYGDVQGYQDMYVPNNPSGDEIVRSINDKYPEAYVRIKNYAGITADHNLYDSILDIPADSWDKSSTTIFEDSVRSSRHYDSGNVNQWSVEELDYLLFSQQCKTGHKGTNFFKIANSSLASNDRKYLSELFSYGTDKITTQLDSVLSYTGDLVALANCIKLYCDASVEQSIWLRLAGITGEDSVQIYWGDGTKRELVTMDGTEIQPLHTYAGTGAYTIYVANPDNVFAWRIGTTLGTDADVAPLNRDISEYYKSTRLDKFYTLLTNGEWIGSIEGLPTTLTQLTLSGGGANQETGGNYIYGNIEKFINLTILRIWGESTITGSIEPLTKLVYAYIAGRSTISGDASLCTELKTFETAMVVTGWSLRPYLVINDISQLTNLTHYCTNVHMYGSITLLTGLRYCSSIDVQSITGDITNLVDMWSFETNGTFTGDVSGWTKLQHGSFSSHTSLTKLTRVNNMPQLVVFDAPTIWGYSSVEVNQLLADVWTNRNEAKTNIDGSSVALRHIDLNNFGFGAPTGQGITDKAALQAYRSPTPPGTAALWTIDTN